MGGNKRIGYTRGEDTKFTRCKSMAKKTNGILGEASKWSVAHRGNGHPWTNTVGGVVRTHNTYHSGGARSIPRVDSRPVLNLVITPLGKRGWEEQHQKFGRESAIAPS